MEITRYVVGPLQTNTYLLKEGNHVLLIDPASKADKMIDLIGENALDAVLLTHGHFDHIKAVDGLYEHFHMPVYLKKEDEVLARDKYQGRMFNIFNYLSCPTVDVSEGPFEIGPFKGEIYWTPGHTQGSVLYRFEDALFTGDTLFQGSVGRTDMEGGNESQLRASLRIFQTMDPAWMVYPGHGPESDIGTECLLNEYLR